MKNRSNEDDSAAKSVAFFALSFCLAGNLFLSFTSKRCFCSVPRTGTEERSQLNIQIPVADGP